MSEVAMLTGKEAVGRVKTALEAAGLQQSSMSGADLTGWTRHAGSTGFSIRANGRGEQEWQIIISGKPHLNFVCKGSKEVAEEPQLLVPRIRKVFSELGMNVKSVEVGGARTNNNGDVSYRVITDPCAWLHPFN